MDAPLSNHHAPAFPAVNAGNDQPSFYHEGLSKYETFAMAAMQGLLANPEYRGGVRELAEDALLHADTLLSALNKRQPKNK